jgi:hypothetical protein
MSGPRRRLQQRSWPKAILEVCRRLLASLLALAAAAARAMEWIAGAARRASGADVQSSGVQKLRGYHDLAKARGGGEGGRGAPLRL